MASTKAPFGGGAVDLTTGPIARSLLMFSLPALGSNVLQSINGSVNAIWIGQFLGERGLAATANANMITFMMISMVFGFGMASTIVIGQAMGRKDVNAMREAFGTGVAIFLALGFFVAVTGWIFSPALLQLLGTPEDAYPMALVYLRWMFLGMPFMLLSTYLALALRSVGDSMTPLILMLPGLVVDIVLNPILILGLGPAPRMGIAGSGLATFIAGGVSVALLLWAIYKRDLPIRLRGDELRYLKPKPELTSVILRKGAPMGLQMIVLSFSAMVMIGMINAIGTNAVAAYGAINQIWTYIQMPAIAIGMAVSAMAAQNIGAKRWDRLSEITRAGIVINLCLTGALVLLTVLFDRVALGLFLPGADEAIDIGVRIGLLASWSFILMGVSAVLSAVMRANGVAVAPLIILIVAYIPGRLGAIYALRPLIGDDAIWWSFPIGSAISLALTGAYYMYGPWRQSRMIATVEEAEEFVQATAEPAGRMMPND
jgi:putative MATE family efflux protein